MKLGTSLTSLLLYKRRVLPAVLLVAAVGCGGSDYDPTGAAPFSAPTTGTLSVVVTGLPSGADAAVTVKGPGGYFRQLAVSEKLAGLAEGPYEVTAVQASTGGDRYAPQRVWQRVTVTRGMSADATIPYMIATGAVAVSVVGLPSGVTPAVSLAGPAGFSAKVMRDTTFRGLVPGTYVLSAAPVSSASGEYRAGATAQIPVTASSTPFPLPVSYRLSPVLAASYNLTIDGLHIQQVVQRYDGKVPLVSGRDGLLRVFVKASAPNTARPAVRVRLYRGETLVSTSTINAPGAAVPTAVEQHALGSSWNLVIPAAHIVPGLRVLADVDPTEAVDESSEDDNTFPASGSALPVDVVNIPAFDIRLVPVRQSANSLTGAVTAANAETWLNVARKLLPLGNMNVDVREPFTTHAPALQANDGNRAWTQVLSELNALRVADGSGRYYAGIARVSYSSGIAGLGYVPGRATLAWDNVGSAPDVIAHELGHNFGRLHAPCGGAGGPDPAYPYTGGTIGVYGYDFAAATLKAPTTSDLMGYCGANWISDYTYTAVLRHRLASPPTSSSLLLPGSVTRPGLLIWGRIENGRPILEPAFEINAPASLPVTRGSHRLQAFGALGETLLDLSFEGEKVADDRDPTLRHFAFVIPLDMLRGVPPAALRLTSHGTVAEQRGSSREASARTATARRDGAGAVRVRWSDPVVKGIMVRNARTGQILSFARNGEAIVGSSASDLELVASDGVYSARVRLRVGVGGER